jgi:hypothetical protein
MISTLNLLSFFFEVESPLCLFISVLVNMLLLEPQTVLQLTNKYILKKGDKKFYKIKNMKEN